MSCRLYGRELLEGAGDLLMSHNIEDGVISYGATFDSRAVEDSAVFFAMKTDKRDGHEYIADAIKNGANCLVVEQVPNLEIEEAKSNGKKVYYIQVTNTLLAMQRMASHLRSTVFEKAKVIGITGSVGKTSITRAIGLVMSMFNKAHLPYKNFNNHIGLPITILNAPRDAEVLVLEMGVSQEGEMEVLSQIAKPNIAIITNIHPVHVGNFGSSTERIAREKSKIFSHLQDGGVIILNQSSEHFDLIKGIAKKASIKNIVSVGEKASHLFVSRCDVGDLCTIDYEVAIKGVPSESRISGVINSISEHDVFNMLFVYAVARLFRLDENIVSQAITKISIPDGRGNIQKLFFDGKKIFIINGSYNASPPSVRDGIIVAARLKQMQGGRTVCVLADMLELGDTMTEPHHREIGKAIKENGIDKVITVGDFTKYTLDELPENMSIQHFKHSMSLTKKIRSLIQDGDIVLFKGSNGMNLSIAIDKLCR